MREIAATVAALVVLAYVVRLITLQWSVHQVSFVLQHVLSAVLSLYSAYSLWAYGWGVIEVLGPCTAAVYLIRSRRSFEIAKTEPAELGSEIDMQRHTVFKDNL